MKRGLLALCTACMLVYPTVARAEDAPVGAPTETNIESSAPEAFYNEPDSLNDDDSPSSVVDDQTSDAPVAQTYVNTTDFPASDVELVESVPAVSADTPEDADGVPEASPNQIDVTDEEEVEAPSDPLIPEGVYVIRSLNADREVLDVAYKSTDAGANVLIWSSKGGDNQKWQLQYEEDGSCTLRSVLSGKLLDVAHASTQAGANVLQWTENGGANQRWRIADGGSGAYVIASALSDNLVLDICNATKTDGGNVIVWTPNGGLNQLWEFVSAEIPAVEPGLEIQDGWYHIDAADNVLLDVSNKSTKDGANITLWNGNGGTNQLYYLDYEDGYVTLKAGTGGYVSTTGADPIPGSNICQRTEMSGNSSKFSVEVSSEGAYQLRNVANGLLLSASSDKSGANVQSGVTGIPVALERATSLIDDGVFYISPVHAANRYMGATSIFPEAGASASIDIMYAGLNQKWIVRNIEGLENTFQLICAASGLAMSVSDNAATLRACDALDSAQLWHAIPTSGSWVLENDASAMLLDVANASSNRGARVCAWTSNGGANQRFSFARTSYLENNTIVVIALADNVTEVIDVNNKSKNDNAAITVWAKNGGANQQWRVSSQKDGSCILTNVNSGKRLSLTSDGRLTQLAATQNALQAWNVEFDYDTSSLHLIAVGSDTALGLHCAGSSNGSALTGSADSQEATGFTFYSSKGYGQDLASANSAQKRIAQIAWAEPTTPTGYCAMWIHNIFEGYGWYDIGGNACDLYDNYCRSTNYNDLKVGMIVAVSRHPGTVGGRVYGHIGIYVGDGILLDSSGSVRQWKVEDWVNSYNGWVPAKWGWYGNRALA